MQDQILQVDENMLETRLDRLVSEKVEQLLNAMLDAEADEITGAARYERTGDRKAYRVGHYERDLTVKAGTVTLKVPKLKGALFESAVIERYRRREQSVEEALIDMYLAGVSTRQVDDISRLLWGERMPSQTLSCLCSISCCGFSHDDFSGLGRACRPRNGLNWMVLVSPPERTGK
ncbi:transposase, partial [Bifidobacterium longum]|uniref:transposase n=2 Tax=Bifidobacterium longum TaxID=216816 RepID=UPI001CC65D05